MSILNSTMITTGPYLTGTVGSSGTYTVSSGSSGLSCQDMTINAANISSPLHVKGDAEIDGNLKVGGKDLTKTLEKIEERLNILTIDPELEERWQELRELGDRYRELETEILLKEKMIEILRR